jgi:hypothetical protein
MVDRDSPVADSAQAWLTRKIQTGKLLRLPTYYPAAGDAGRRPDKYARMLLAGWENPQEAVHPRAWYERETQCFRQWVASGPLPRPIHPASGSVAARDVVAPQGVSWSPPHDRGYVEPRPSPRLRRRHFSVDFRPRPVRSKTPVGIRWIYVALCLGWCFAYSRALRLPVSGGTFPVLLAVGSSAFVVPLLWRVIWSSDPKLARLRAGALRKSTDRGSMAMHDPWLDGFDEGR